MDLTKKVLLFFSCLLSAWIIHSVFFLGTSKVVQSSSTFGSGILENDLRKSETCECSEIELCCCSVSELEETNRKLIYPLFKKIVLTPFFSHFQVDLCSQCDLWLDSPLCKLRDCSVCECENPPDFTKTLKVPQNNLRVDCEDQVDSTVDVNVSAKISAEWAEASDKSVVDLRLNPERFTGYDGESAAKVWDAIHGNSCSFSDKQCDANQEMSAFNRILSGMHSSISLHIAHDYCVELDKTQIGECARWSSAPLIAKERVLDHPDRIDNLYFAYAVLLRAVIKAGSRISTAVPHNEPLYESELREWEHVLLPKVERLVNSCPVMFDEKSLFDGVNSTQLRTQVEQRCQMLQRIMRCVGCDRCKLWGSLQALGVHTALRVLFPISGDSYELTRQEAIALTNTLERFATSVIFLKSLKDQMDSMSFDDSTTRPGMIEL